jgi:putative endonuclease
MTAHNEFGRAAEVEAADLLQRNGWTILERNWRAGRQEIDVIALRGTLVAFVEVKARASARYGHPLEAIGWRKRRDLARAARVWIRLNGRSGQEYRFDAVHVIGRHPAEWTVRHVEDAWWLGGV